MRDVILGGGGLVLGGVLGAGATLALEALVAVVVVGTLWASTPPGPPPPVDAASAPVALARPAGAARQAPVGAPGEVQVLTMAAVQLSLDGAPMPFDSSQGYLVSALPGRHRLQVTDLMGRITADQEIEVGSGRRSQFRFAKGALTDLGAMPMPGTAGGAATVVIPAAVVEAPPVAVDAEVRLEVETPVEPKVTLGSGPQAVEIKLPKIGFSRK